MCANDNLDKVLCITIRIDVFFSSTDHGMWEAAVNGAWQAGKSGGTLVLMVISMVSLYYFLDASMAWLGGRVGLDTSLEVRLIPAALV